jgi:acyl-CoA thioester hydrolase
MNNSFIFPIRVYYEDTDAGGVVYHSTYLNFMERARTEWLRHLGFEQPSLRQIHNIIFVVKQLTIDYHKPAHFNHLLNVSVRVTTLKKASMILAQDIRHQTQVLCTGHVKIACVTADTMRPVAMPQNLQKVLNYE